MPTLRIRFVGRRVGNLPEQRMYVCVLASSRHPLSLFRTAHRSSSVLPCSLIRRVCHGLQATRVFRRAPFGTTNLPAAVVLGTSRLTVRALAAGGTHSYPRGHGTGCQPGSAPPVAFCVAAYSYLGRFWAPSSRSSRRKPRARRERGALPHRCHIAFALLGSNS